MKEKRMDKQLREIIKNNIGYFENSCEPEAKYLLREYKRDHDKPELKNRCKFAVLKFDPDNHEILIHYRMLPSITTDFENTVRDVLFKCVIATVYDTYYFDPSEESINPAVIDEWVNELKEHMLEFRQGRLDITPGII
jgi:hypothetical protein